MFIITAIIFIVGIVIGNFIPKLFPSPPNNNIVLPKGVEEISPVTANKLFRDYYKGATADSQPFAGFLLKKEQLDVLNILLKKNLALSGFRIYMSNDSSGLERRILVGCKTVGDKQIDDATIIFKTIYGASDPCPPICDMDSPITRP